MSRAQIETIIVRTTPEPYRFGVYRVDGVVREGFISEVVEYMFGRQTGGERHEWELIEKEPPHTGEGLAGEEYEVRSGDNNPGGGDVPDEGTQEAPCIEDHPGEGFC